MTDSKGGGGGGLWAKEGTWVCPVSKEVWSVAG